MKVLCFVIAEAASVSPERYLTITNAFDHQKGRRVAGVPAHGPFGVLLRRAAIVAYVEWEPPTNHRGTLECSIAAENGVVLFTSPTLPIEVTAKPGDRLVRYPFVIPVENIELVCPGAYDAQLFVDGELRADHRFYLDEAGGGA